MASSRWVALLGIGLAAACASRRPHVVTVAQALAGGPQLADARVVLVGRAENVRLWAPMDGASAVTFRLVDGTGAIDVVHPGTVRLHDDELVHVRGTLQLADDGMARPRIQASTIWRVGARPP